MTKTMLALTALTLLAFGCDSGEETAAEATTAAEPAAAETQAPEAVEEPVAEAPRDTSPEGLALEQATLPTIGHTMLLPEGFSRDRETETGAGYSFDLGNFKTIMVSLEPQGASSEREARSMGPVVAGGLTVSDVSTLENGNHLVLFETRERDGMQGVAVFSATHYVKCMGPEAYVAKLREMCESFSPAE